MGGEAACVSLADGQRQKEGRRGWRAAGCSRHCCGCCRGRGGEPMWRPLPCPCVEPAQGLPCPCPSLALKRSRVPWLSTPLSSPMSSAAGQQESWDLRAGLGGQEAGEELPRSCWGLGAPGKQLPAPDRSSAAGTRPCLSSQIDFPLSFSPSPICSCSDSRLQPCLLGERRCPCPAAGSRCSVVPYGYRS